MRAAILHAFGTAPRAEHIPEPVGKGDEVIVQVRAAAIHPIVKALASGKALCEP